MSATDSAELPSHLQVADPQTFRIGRRKRGEGWQFHFTDTGKPVRSAALLRRLRDVPVPATWTDVTLSSHPTDHILASGYDGSGKHQYLYHDDYLEYRNERKFSELLEFGLALPRIRRRVTRDLKQEEWTQTRLLALMVRILDRYHLRVGSRVYAARNKTFGLTTLRKRHLREEESQLVLDFLSKGGKRKIVHLADPELVAMIRELAEFPGWELFSIHQGDRSIDVDAPRINEYIREISGGNFTARTFRTWGGTVSCVQLLERARREIAVNPRRQLMAALCDLVAARLGNTPAICREYYIHPHVLESVLADDFDDTPNDCRLPGQGMYRKHECRTIQLLSALA